MDNINLIKLLADALTKSKKSSDSGDKPSGLNLNSIMGLIEKFKNTPSSTTNSTETTPSPTPKKPLQASMIATMTSHDEFIKRVKEKNKPKK